jgi:DNA repair protein RecN (Recombination protein N)
MLCELRVENLLLIERAELALGPGLNVLTGETGAGKTMLADALDLLMGGRSRAGIVRPGAAEAYVEGVLTCSESQRAQLREQTGAVAWLQDDAEELVLARRVLGDGRTRAYVNGRSATVGDLRELGARMISFYGQHEHRKLVLAGAQREILDLACGEPHAATLAACAHSYRNARALEAQLAECDELAAAAERELDLLEHELAEIEAAAPDEQEHLALLAQRERLRSLEELRRAAAGAIDELAPEAPNAGSASHATAAAAARLNAIPGIDAELDALAERCAAAAIEIEDIAAGLRAYGEGLDGDDGALQAVEERLAQIERLMRKHGGGIAAVLEHAEHARSRREQLVGAKSSRQEIGQRLATERDALQRHVSELRAARKRAAAKLAKQVRRELAALAMADATFQIDVQTTEPGASGGDDVQFTIAPNPGVAAAPLREIASGGELSRVMLALITACGSDASATSAWSGSTIVFDEIDAGIGGQTARAVGERLRALAASRQVLCITHLPQIASLAQRHFQVAKDTSAEPTLTSIVQLAEDQVVGELVRMLGAEEHDAGAVRHARELLRAA